jgi:hypothetical protein
MCSPDAGTCSALHLSPQQADAGRVSAMRLASITAEVARQTRSGLIQASQITHGHDDICSPQPWVYGFQFPKRFLSFSPAPFHPKMEAMQAIASVLAERFSGGSSNIHAEDEQESAWDGSSFFSEQDRSYPWNGIRIARTE